MVQLTGAAEALPNLGTSDHVSIKFRCDIDKELTQEPQATAVYDWHSAPWNHIRGALKRALETWNDCEYDHPDEAEAQPVHYIQPVISDYVKKVVLKTYNPAPYRGGTGTAKKLSNTS